MGSKNSFKYIKITHKNNNKGILHLSGVDKT